LIADGSFLINPAFKDAIEHVKNNNSALHLLGLIGAGGVHSSLEHLFALLRLAKNENVKQVWLHLFTDGRDSPPTSAGIYLEKTQTICQQLGIGQFATLIGRYYAMDRDLRWERIQKAYDLLTLGAGNKLANFKQALKLSYENGKTDEFLEPVVLNENGLVKDNDAVIFFNFRIDRPRELTKAFVLPNFENMAAKSCSFDPYAEKYGLKQFECAPGSSSFKRNKILKNLFFVTMTEYEKNLPTHIAYPPDTVKLPLARILSEEGLRQIHISETEKERFVTYYFDGQKEDPYPGEDWKEIPSLKVATYDLKPEMSALQVKEEVIKALQSGTYNFITVNFANPDMVGHTGVLSAGIKACEVVDQCLGEVVNTVQSLNGISIITADHGNVEEMIDLATGEINTEHSNNPVPFIIVHPDPNLSGKTLAKGILADVAPTILALYGINIPESMTGRNLLS